MQAVAMDDSAHPTHAPPKASHMLAGLLCLQGLAAAGSLAFLVVNDGRDPTAGLPLFFLVVAVLSFLAAGLEWARQRWAIMVATVALLLSFGLTLAAVLAGVWYLVPFVGLATIAAIFGLVDTVATRESAGAPGSGHH